MYPINNFTPFLCPGPSGSDHTKTVRLLYDLSYTSLLRLLELEKTSHRAQWKSPPYLMARKPTHKQRNMTERPKDTKTCIEDSHEETPTSRARKPREAQDSPPVPLSTRVPNAPHWGILSRK